MSRNKFTFYWGGIFPLLLFTAFLIGCNNHYNRVKAIKLTAIYEPTNLSDDPECKRLWREIARASLNMDEFSDNWNEVIVENAYKMVEINCSQERK